MAKECKVLKMDDEESYSITGPNGEEGDVFQYGTLATVTSGNEIYYLMLAGPEDEAPVRRVVSSEEVATVFEEDVAFDNEDDDEDEDDLRERVKKLEQQLAERASA